MKSGKIIKVKMYDNTIAFVDVKGVNRANIQRIEYAYPNRWEARFVMKCGEVLVRKIAARMGGS